MAKKRKDKCRIRSIPQFVTQGSVSQSATTSAVVSCSLVFKRGVFFRVFHFMASGIQQPKFLNQCAQIKTNLTDGYLRILSFDHPWIFFGHSCPLSALSNPGWTEVVQWMKHNPPHDSAVGLISLVCFHTCSSIDVILHQPIT